MIVTALMWYRVGSSNGLLALQCAVLRHYHTEVQEHCCSMHVPNNSLGEYTTGTAVQVSSNS